MILTTHILSGAALGANVQNPVAIAGLSIVLHFLLDILPHGDYLNKKSRFWEFWKVAVDLAIGSSLVAAILFYRGETSTVYLENIAIGIFFSLLPDGLTFCYWELKMKFLQPVYDFHQNLHRLENGALQRQFLLKNNLWDIFITLTSLLILFFGHVG